MYIHVYVYIFIHQNTHTNIITIALHIMIKICTQPKHPPTSIRGNKLQSTTHMEYCKTRRMENYNSI
jgi:hypothetical protein